MRRRRSDPRPPATGPRVGDQVEIGIEKLVAGGDGLGRTDGLAVFVPFAAPGDRLRVRITERRGGFARARIVAVLRPGPGRIAPRCRHFGECGGCRLQHVDPAAQAAAKGEIVREALRRLGGIRWDAEIPVRTGPPYGWRSRGELRRKAGRLGQLREGSHDFVAVDECPLLVPRAESLLEELAAGPDGTVRFAVGDDGEVASDPTARVTRRVHGFAFEFGAGDFFQGNRSLVGDLVREVEDGRKGGLAVDLYAGVGLFTLPLARSFREVVAVEGSAAAAQGEANARANGVGNVRFVHRSVNAWLSSHEGPVPDLVVLDPPRTGAGPEVVARLASLAPVEMVYVSCDPATLARDLRGLVGAGYRVVSVVALDMFPQTAHVETVVGLTAHSTSETSRSQPSIRDPDARASSPQG